MSDLRLSSIRFVPARHDDGRHGLVGWVSFLLSGSIKVDGVAVHLREGGGYALSFPERTDRSGRRHALICPVTDASRRAIETAVFEKLGLEYSP